MEIEGDLSCFRGEVESDRGVCRSAAILPPLFDTRTPSYVSLPATPMVCECDMRQALARSLNAYLSNTVYTRSLASTPIALVRLTIESLLEPLDEFCTPL